ncbi:hypothetical protein OK074_4990 [Actinobacteria bacterium OK074]|nr:hypothetical protein OK074_4990 [Actinobacteria bacterium OK074]
MHQTDLPAEIARLRHLGREFEHLHHEIRSLPPMPCTDARSLLTSKITVANGLVAQAMQRLAALDGSQYTVVPGSGPALRALASIVYAASLGASDLAAALYAKPLGGAPYPGQPSGKAAVRKANLEAGRVMDGKLENALYQFDQAHTGCSYLISAINRDLEQHAENLQTAPAPQITASQHTALAALSHDGGRLFESGRGTLRASTTGGITLNIATVKALHVRGLISIDATTSLLQGQRLSVTAQGERARAQHKPTTASAPSAAMTPPAQQQAQVRTR